MQLLPIFVSDVPSVRVFAWLVALHDQSVHSHVRVIDVALDIIASSRKELSVLIEPIKIFVVDHGVDRLSERLQCWRHIPRGKLPSPQENLFHCFDKGVVAGSGADICASADAL